MKIISTSTVLDHFYSPRNCGDIAHADSIGIEEDAERGIVIKFFIKVGNEVVSEIKFKTFGCITSIACASAATELAKGKKLEEALTLSYEDISGALGGIPKEKIHCSHLAISALHKALRNYLNRRELCEWPISSQPPPPIRS